MTGLSTRCRRAPAGLPRRRGAQRGMALLEALIAILVFTFGILGLIGLEASAINSAVDSDDRNRAALFASEIASAMWLANSVDQTNVNIAPQYAIWQATVGDPTKTEWPMAPWPSRRYQPSPTRPAPSLRPTSRSRGSPGAGGRRRGSLSQLTTRVILP